MKAILGRVAGRSPTLPLATAAKHFVAQAVKLNDNRALHSRCRDIHATMDVVQLTKGSEGINCAIRIRAVVSSKTLGDYQMGSKFTLHRRLASILGGLAIATFIASFIFFSVQTDGFDPLHDYMSKLGAIDAPLAFWWNLIGFGTVGALYMGFGWVLGVALRDWIVGVCTALMGMGFMLAAAPTDFQNSMDVFSRVHFASICLSLAGWCLTLARLGSIQAAYFETSSKIFVALGMTPIVLSQLEVLSAPLAHRFILAVVFAWTIFMARSLHSISPEEQ